MGLRAIPDASAAPVRTLKNHWSRAVSGDRTTKPISSLRRGAVAPLGTIEVWYQLLCVLRSKLRTPRISGGVSVASGSSIQPAGRHYGA